MKDNERKLGILIFAAMICFTLFIILSNVSAVVALNVQSGDMDAINIMQQVITYLLLIMGLVFLFAAPVYAAKSG